jgi:hypothetical protein
VSPPATQRLAEIHAPALLIVGDRHTTDVVNEAQLVESGITGIKKMAGLGMAQSIMPMSPRRG